MKLIKENKELAKDIQMTIDLLNKIEMLTDNGKHDALVRQLIRCSSSMVMNGDTTSSSKSVGAFIDKLRKQEIDNKKAKEKLKVLLLEADQLLSIYAPTKKAIRENRVA